MIVTLKQGSKVVSPLTGEFFCPRDLQLTLPVIHAMVIGTPNSGKTQFAASAENPKLVFAFDPFDKLFPYFDRGLLDPEVKVGQFGQLIWIVKSPKTGNAIMQIEGFYDENDKNPQAMQGFMQRLDQAVQEVKQGMWKTIVLDSWSQLEWIARQRRTTGPFATGDSVYASAMDDLKGLVNSRIMNLRCNVVTTFHIETKVVRNRQGTVVKDSKDDVGGGELSYNIAAIGSLKNLGNVFGETYLAEAPIDGSDKFVLHTKRNFNFRTLCSRIYAADPCPNEWNSLFTNWIARQAKMVFDAEASNQPAPSASPAEAS